MKAVNFHGIYSISQHCYAMLCTMVTLYKESSP